MKRPERTYLLDSSVLLAVLRHEDGEGLERATELLALGKILSVNLTEAVFDLSGEVGTPAAILAVDALEVPVLEFTEEMAKAAAGIRRNYKRKFEISTGDACCLAAAQVAQLSVATKDEPWLQVNEVNVENIWPNRNGAKPRRR